jgi:eukaryotic-like serine/threonine-protein kinase
VTPEQWEALSSALVEVLEGRVSLDRTSAPEELAPLVLAHEQAGDWLESSPWDPMLGQTLGGRYKLIRVLGRGASATVYVASDSCPGEAQKVVKVLHSFWSSDARMRAHFHQEAQVLSRLRHPGIVELLEAGESSEGLLHLVMPYREGRTLRQAMSDGPIPLASAARIIRGIGDALQYAHEHGITHRDLKPENVLLVRDGETELPILLDFGVADIRPDPAASLTNTTHVLGSPLYMAPEHLMGRPQRASDTYSLAVIAWEMLTGRHPFDARTPFELPALQRRGVDGAFYAARPDLSVMVGRKLEAALAFDLKKRPQSTSAFASDVAAALLRPSAADSPVLRLWARPASRRAILGAGAASAVGLGFARWWWQSEFRPLREEERAIVYRGGSAIEDSGFRRSHDLKNEVLHEPGRSGYRIDRFFTASQGHAYYPLTPLQSKQAFQRGWRLTAKMRPEVGYLATGLSIGTGEPRFDVSLGCVGGRWSATATTRIRNGWTGFTIPLDPRPALELIDVEIHYDAATRRARVRAGNQLVTDRYDGCLEYRDEFGVFLSVFVDQLGEAHGLVGDARFEIL